MDGSSDSAKWTWDQNKAFEVALTEFFDEEEPAKWEKIAARLPGKTPEEIMTHYEILVRDVDAIAAGHVPFPKYVDAPEISADLSDDGGKKGRGKASKSEHERRKGIAWTEDEHRLFLLGLEKYGKGDWRSISRNFVVTRTPTQVASHAQKYFIRQNSVNKDRRRSSIHDITSVGSGEVPTPPGPITGEAAVPNASAPAKPGNLTSSGPAGSATYGSPAIGHPVQGPLVPAVGTPVSIPTPPTMAYGLRPAVSGGVVPGMPMNAPAANRPKSHASGRR